MGATDTGGLGVPPPGRHSGSGGPGARDDSFMPTAERGGKGRFAVSVGVSSGSGARPHGGRPGSAPLRPRPLVPDAAAPRGFAGGAAAAPLAPLRWGGLSACPWGPRAPSRSPPAPPQPGVGAAARALFLLCSFCVTSRRACPARRVSVTGDSVHQPSQSRGAVCVCVRFSFFIFWLNLKESPLLPNAAPNRVV